jgi:hypothetical protein
VTHTHSDPARARSLQEKESARLSFRALTGQKLGGNGGNNRKKGWASPDKNLSCGKNADACGFHLVITVPPATSKAHEQSQENKDKFAALRC